MSDFKPKIVPAPESGRHAGKFCITKGAGADTKFLYPNGTWHPFTKDSTTDEWSGYYDNMTKAEETFKKHSNSF